MPVIKIIDPRDSTQGPGQGSHVPAAVMAVALSKGSEPVEAVAKRPKRARAERTRPRNPNRLTVNQHVFPLKTMEQFAQDGRISVHLIARGDVRSIKPDNPLFCARRAWDQRAEAGYMKQIEDEFQATTAPIIDGKVGVITPAQKPIIDRMYALWYMRARFRDLEEQEIQLKGVVGDDLTKEQEEYLEKNAYLFARKAGNCPRGSSTACCCKCA
jgi:hypothetical protein